MTKTAAMMEWTNGRGIECSASGTGIEVPEWIWQLGRDLSTPDEKAWIHWTVNQGLSMNSGLSAPGVQAVRRAVFFDFAGGVVEAFAIS